MNDYDGPVPKDVTAAAHAILQEALKYDRCLRCDARADFFLSVRLSKHTMASEYENKEMPFVDPIARAIMAERERCATQLESEAQLILDDIVPGDVVGEKMFNFAAGVLMTQAVAIRGGKP